MSLDFILKIDFFFTPGFPSMSQAMVYIEALDKIYSKSNIENID